ncbi:MAG: hypothetical protein HY094_05670 [Candidatus Melainabacteria bacterium]|nr:hypothetical protein [Candidatus Melainabacteria bacterium]
MNVTPVVYITTYKSLNPFKMALLSCSEIGQFAFDKEKDKNILSLPIQPEQQVDFAVREIIYNLKHTGNDVVVDADALQSALAFFNVIPYRKAWGITEDMMKRIYEIVYDPRAPHRAEIVQGITNALRLQDIYSRTEELKEPGMEN